MENEEAEDELELKNPYPILEEASDELEAELKYYKDAILNEANNLAHKEGHTFLDKTYIKKASKRIQMLGNSTKIWALRITILIFMPLFIANQIESLLSPEVLASPVGLQISLWLLPLFSIVLIFALSYALKDVIFP